jgi:hypothetical protein
MEGKQRLVSGAFQTDEIARRGLCTSSTSLLGVLMFVGHQLADTRTQLWFLLGMLTCMSVVGIFWMEMKLKLDAITNDERESPEKNSKTLNGTLSKSSSMISIFNSKKSLSAYEEFKLDFVHH